MPGLSGRKRGDQAGKTKCGKGCKVVDFAAANSSEVKLIEPFLENLQIPGKVSEHPLYDKAADSNPLRNRLHEERGIELVCPHRKNRKRKPTQHGRSVRKYKRRYKVERTHSWLPHFRRMIILR